MRPAFLCRDSGLRGFGKTGRTQGSTERFPAVADSGVLEDSERAAGLGDPLQAHQRCVTVCGSNLHQPPAGCSGVWEAPISRLHPGMPHVPGPHDRHSCRQPTLPADHASWCTSLLFVWPHHKALMSCASLPGSLISKHHSNHNAVMTVKKWRRASCMASFSCHVDCDSMPQVSRQCQGRGSTIGSLTILARQRVFVQVH